MQGTVITSPRNFSVIMGLTDVVIQVFTHLLEGDAVSTTSQKIFIPTESLTPDSHTESISHKTTATPDPTDGLLGMITQPFFSLDFSIINVSSIIYQ